MFCFNGLFITGLLATSTFAVPVEQQQRGLSSDKRGLAYNEGGLLTSLIGQAVFSWQYNWGTEPGQDAPENVEYVPMLWGEKHFDQWADKVEIALSSGAEHILGFNEPDYSGQANMSPEKAVKAWKEHMEPYADRAKLGSPGVTNGQDADMGLNWLRSFFDACAGECTVDFLAVHWYSPATMPEDFKSHVEEAIDLANEQGVSEVWVTEFQGEGDHLTQAEFLMDVLPWLDNKDGVARYAYFKADKFLDGSGLTSLGEAYCG